MTLGPGWQTSDSIAERDLTKTYLQQNFNQETYRVHVLKLCFNQIDLSNSVVGVIV